MVKKKFLRRTWNRYPKLGKKRKKKQKWRKPTGRDNKMREKRKGYPKVVSVGYKKDKNSRGKIKGKKPILVNNVNDLERIKQNNIAIIGSIGKKKKIEIAEKIKQKNIPVQNLNVEKFLKKIKKSKKEQITDKEKPENKKNKTKEKKK